MQQQSDPMPLLSTSVTSAYAACYRAAIVRSEPNPPDYAIDATYDSLKDATLDELLLKRYLLRRMVLVTSRLCSIRRKLSSLSRCARSLSNLIFLLAVEGILPLKPFKRLCDCCTAAHKERTCARFFEISRFSSETCSTAVLMLSDCMTYKNVTSAYAVCTGETKT